MEDSRGVAAREAALSPTLMEPYIYFDEIDQYGPQRKRAAAELSPAQLDKNDIQNLAEVMVEAEGRSGDLEGEYILEGKVDFKADLTCSRCLDPFPVATSSDFTVRFLPRPEFATEEEVQISADELDVEHYTDRFVSLRDLAAEQIHLTVPMKPLCEEACLGLCLHCGSNLNQAACSCKGQETDDRWAALREIREQLSKKKQI